MYFKNLQPYRLSTEWPITAEALHEQLARKPFHSCGSQDFESRGWVAPCDDGDLVHAIGDDWLICLQTETKILPPAVINKEADARAAAIAEQFGYKPGRKQMEELREQVTAEFLPRAFTRIRKTYAWLNAQAGWLAIDAASQNKAEDVLEQMRHALPVALLRTERSPMSAMADWLAASEAPAGFTIDQDCTVRSVAEDRKEVSYRRGINDEQIREHLEAGCLPIKLAMTFDDRVSFVLTERMELKRIDFLDVIRDQAKADEHEDAQALFDAEFALMAGELLRLLDAMVAALGGELVREADLIDEARKAA
jgi:recombination associated protein RdgC